MMRTHTPFMVDIGMRNTLSTVEIENKHFFYGMIKIFFKKNKKTENKNEIV